MKSIRMKIVLSLVLGVFLITLPGSGHAGPKTSAKKTKPAAATPAVNQNVNSWSEPPDKADPKETAKNSKTEFKKYREALQAQHLLDKIISVGSRLKVKSDKFTISTPLRETIRYRNELARDLAILAGIDIVTQVDTDSFMVDQMEIDPGLGGINMDMPSFSPPMESGCGTQYADCMNTVDQSWQGCSNGCGVSCSDCNDAAVRESGDCNNQRRSCNSCERRGEKNCADSLIVTNDLEEWIKQLIGYLDVIEDVINMQNFTHEFDVDTIDFYNNVVDMTHQMIPSQ